MTAPRPRGRVRAGLPSAAVHDALIRVAAPALAVPGRYGRLRAEGCDGLYRDGRRLPARCVLTAAGEESVPVQAALLGADHVRFVAVVRTAADRGPGFSPFGHRSGAVRIPETAVAVAGSATAGLEDAASSLPAECSTRSPRSARACRRCTRGGIRATARRARIRRPAVPPRSRRDGSVHLPVAPAGSRPDAPGTVEGPAAAVLRAGGSRPAQRDAGRGGAVRGPGRQEGGTATVEQVAPALHREA